MRRTFPPQLGHSISVLLMISVLFRSFLRAPMMIPPPGRWLKFKPCMSRFLLCRCHCRELAVVIFPPDTLSNFCVSAAFTVSLRRSKHTTTFGVVLMHSPNLVGQLSKRSCAPFPSLFVVTKASMSNLQQANLAETKGDRFPVLVCQRPKCHLRSLRVAPRTLLTTSLSHLSRGSSLLSSRVVNNLCPDPMKHSAGLFLRWF